MSARSGVAHAFVTRRLAGTALERLALEPDVEVWPERLSPDQPTSSARPRPAAGPLSTVSDRVDAALIAAAPRLRAIADCAGGPGNVDAPGRVALSELLARSDFVSLHCRLTPRTRHLIDAAVLPMKPTAVPINPARGPIVDQVALRATLADGTIAAPLDVTDPDPMPHAVSGP